MKTNSPQSSGCDVQANHMPAMTGAERQKNIDAISTRMRSIADDGDENLQFEYDILRSALIALTTPPAQLLRPVELPKKSDVKMGGDAKTRALLTGMNMMLKSCTEALRQQGYEVKS